MALWDDILLESYKLSKRPDLTLEANIGLRQTVRLAHKSAKFWRDLITVPVLNLDTSVQVQEIDIPTNAPRFRQLAYLRNPDAIDQYYKPVDIADLLDEDNYGRVDVCWGFGTKLCVRAYTPLASYTLAYFAYPNITPATFADWIADDFFDLLVIGTAMNVLQLVGEQEIKGNLEKLFAIELTELKSTNLEIVAR